MPPRTSIPTTLHVPLDSSCIRSVAYSLDAAAMEVTFHNGSIYRYFDVPCPVYHALLKADSKGRYFAAAVRSCFRWERLQ